MTNSNEAVANIAEILSAENWITDEQLSKVSALSADKTKNCEQLFVDAGVSEKALCDAFSRCYGFEIVALSSITPENDALAVLPLVAAERLNALPLSLSENCLSVAISNPSDSALMDELRMLPQKLCIYIAPKSELASAIKFHYKFADVLYKESAETANVHGKLTNAAEEIVDFLIEKSVKDGASDIHFEPLHDKARVRYRIDGMLFDLMTFRVEFYAQVVSRVKILANMDIAEKRLPRDGRILHTLDGLSVDIRVSSLPTIHGEKIVMRLLKQDDTILDLSKLGFNAEQISFLQNATKIRSGLIVVAGPTGSGKSTTLHTLMKLMNDDRTNLISIEDPVEYTLEGINQVQVNEKIGLHFSNILRSVLRQDPDKIMVGEIRDLETAELAIRAALTGHLVLTTLHADDSAGAITRLMDMGIKPYLLSSALKCIISQRLARVLCSDCKEFYAPTDTEMQMLGAKDCVSLARAAGCDCCRYSGYQGRTVIAEMVAVNNDIQKMLNKAELKQNFVQYMKDNSVTSLRDSIVTKIIDGNVPIEELYLLESN